MKPAVTTTALTTTETTLPIPVGGIDGIAVVGDQVIVGLLSTDVEAFHLWRLAVNGASLRQIKVSTGADSDCLHTDYLYPREIGDSKVAVNRVCDTSPDTTGYAASYSIDAYDLGTGTLDQISAPQHSHNPGPTAWNPDRTKGMATIGDGSCLTLIWLTASGESPVDMTLKDGQRHWNLGEPFSGGTCDSQGVAAWPAWSPDGNQIAFAASLDAIGVHGLARGSQPWNLYLTSPSNLKPRLLLRSVFEPRDLHWSHDSRRLAFSGTLEDGQTGTWITDLAGHLARVTGESALYLTWSANDDALLVAVQVPDSENTPLRLVKLPRP